MISLSLFSFAMLFVGYVAGRAHEIWIENREWEWVSMPLANKSQSA
jgi:hypothetical protein